jgi:hypothetical protein
LLQAAFWYKIYIAAVAAAAEQARELQLLNTALGFMNRSMIAALPAVWAESDVNQAYRDAFDAQQMLSASCLCPTVTSLLAGTIDFTDSAAYLAGSCSGARRVPAVCYQLRIAYTLWCFQSIAGSNNAIEPGYTITSCMHTAAAALAY